MNKPMLPIGIIMFTLFIFNKQTRVWWDVYTERFKPNNCRVASERLVKRNVSNWKVSCEGQTLIVESEFNKFVDTKNLRGVMYKYLANTIVNVARQSNLETIEDLTKVKVIVFNNNLKIISLTKGENIINFRTLKTPKAISDHLNATVTVKEVE